MILKLEINPFEDEEGVKLIMVKLGLEEIKYREYEHYDDQIIEPFILDFILASWRGVSRPSHWLADSSMMFMIAHYPGMERILKQMFPLLNPQEKWFLERKAKWDRRAIQPGVLNNRWSLFIVSWLYNVNLTILGNSGGVWHNRNFALFWETNIWILPMKDRWV